MLFRRTSVLAAILFAAVCVSAAGQASEQASNAGPRPPANIVRNASFELGQAWNGTFMRQGSEHVQTHVQRGGRLFWLPTDAEGWWIEGAGPSGVEITSDSARSGKRCLMISQEGDGPLVVASAFDRFVEEGPVTLSAYVKTIGAKGQLQLELTGGWQPVFQNRHPDQSGIALPADSDWTRLTVTADCPGKREAFARVVVTEGTVYLDDVQIEQAKAPTAFDLRPEEQLQIEFADHDNRTLPKWIEGDRTQRRILVHRDARSPLAGAITVFVGPWDDLTRREIGRCDAGALKPGQPASFVFRTDAFPVDAYLATIKLERDGATVLDGSREYLPRQFIGGEASNSALRSRLAVRFLVAPKRNPREIFGVGNGMLQNGAGDTFQGYGIDTYQDTEALGLICSRGEANDDICFVTAAAGIPIHTRLNINRHSRSDLVDPDAHVRVSLRRGRAGGQPRFVNPASPGQCDFYNPEALADFKQWAEATGRQYAANPMVVSVQMANESPYINKPALCPSVHADEHFRQWCKQRHGDLATLNDRWNSNYTDWGQVEQIVSARFVEEEKRRLKLQDKRIDWLGSFRGHPDVLRQRMLDDPGRAMDWMRWRTETSLWIYSMFTRLAKTHDRKTLYSNNLCWPNFFPQMFMPFIRAMDVTMLDCQYTSGFPKSLGNPYEMLEILEMAESTERGKPIWGIEIYVQATWPAEYAAFQNWAMVAHGVTNNLVFAWKPFTNGGMRAAFPEGGNTGAWEKPGAPPIWCIVDGDGTKLPNYYSYARSIKEINRYHERFDGHSTRRVDTDVAMYISPDTAEYVMMQNRGKPWGSPWTRTRNNLAYTLRMQGITADFVDDATLPKRPGRFRTLIVPASCVLNQAAAARIADFAKRGGAVVLAGMTGIYDPWLNKYDNVGGTAWSDLEWKAPDFKPEYVNVAFDRRIVPADVAGLTAAEKEATIGGKIDEQSVEGKTFRGADIGVIPNATPIEDAIGNTVGYNRKWGNGRLIAYGVFPDTYVTNPHPALSLTYWVRQIIDLVDLDFTGRWRNRAEPSTEGHLGSGQPVVEVVVRIRSDREKFVFCFNQGGAGDGTIEVPVGQGTWLAEEVIGEKPVEGAAVSDGVWRLPLHLDPWQYRVFRLYRART